MSSPSELPKNYDPSEVEPRWLNFWLAQGYFHADAAAAVAPFAITLPPPNVTGSLHMGHALGGTIQDILIRWRRMQGRNAMWMPGTDHAGIATQMLVERDLARREGKSRHDLGRDGFLERVWAWKEKHGGRIFEQMRTMGFSLDYARERFTMDPGATAAVREVFVKLYEEGLIYRAHRLVNWCPDCYTALSDLEVNNVDEKGHLWQLQYPVVDDPAGRRITVATTRPETMLGDTGVAVHPSDERYRDLVGKRVMLPLTGRTIPIVADEFVDPEFGSGAVKVTPGHDFNDFEAGQRAGLEILSIIDTHGRVIAPAPARYVGMTVAQARDAVVADLEAEGFLGEIEDYTVPRGRCDRSGTVVEPLLVGSVVAVDGAAGPARHRGGRERQDPLRARAVDQDLHALDDQHQGLVHLAPALVGASHPGLVLRRLRRGHGRAHRPDRVPGRAAAARCGRTRTSSTPGSRRRCGRSRPWAGPRRPASSPTFYPNAVLVTGPDIIFFWVARMMMMGMHFMGKVPFRTVYLTPIVTDENGDKMSKVKGNVIDPLDIVHGATFEQLIGGRAGQRRRRRAQDIKKSLSKGIPAAGADALRFSLAAMTSPGRNVRLAMDRIEGYRNFINKLWNASRFALMNLERLRRREVRRGPGRHHPGRRAGPVAGRPLDPVAAPAHRRAGRSGARRVSASARRPTPSTTSCGTSCATGTSSWPSRPCTWTRPRPTIPMPPSGGFWPRAPWPPPSS